MQQFASRITYGVLSSDLTIESGQPVRVYGGIITNELGSSQVFTIKNGAGTSIFKMAIPANSSFDFRTNFIAGTGIVVSADSPSASLSAAVFHTHSGS